MTRAQNFTSHRYLGTCSSVLLFLLLSFSFSLLHSLQASLPPRESLCPLSFSFAINIQRNSDDLCLPSFPLFRLPSQAPCVLWNMWAVGWWVVDILYMYSTNPSPGLWRGAHAHVANESCCTCVPNAFVNHMLDKNKDGHKKEINGRWNIIRAILLLVSTVCRLCVLTRWSQCVFNQHVYFLSFLPSADEIHCLCCCW